MALPGLVLPRNGDSSSGSAQSSSFEGLAERMNEHRKKKKKQEDDSAAATRAAEAKKKADEKSKADKAAQDKKNSLPSKVTAGIKDIFQANTEADKQRRVEQGQPAEYSDQQKQKKATADAFKGKTSDEFGRADDGLNLSAQEFEQRRQHYKDSGIDVDQLQKDRAEYQKIQERLKKGEKLYKLTLDNQIPEGAKRYDAERDKVKKAESTYQRNLKASAGAESNLQQFERGFVRGAGQPLVEVPSSVETLVGSALQAVAPDGSRIQKAGDKLHEKGKTDREELATKIATSGYAPQQTDNQFVAGVSEGSGSLLASLTAARLAKSLPVVGGSTKAATTVPAAVFGINQGADQELAADKAGKSDVQSFVTGLIAGGAEAGLEKFGLDKFLGATGSPVKQAATRMITEGMQEMTQSLAQSGVQASYESIDVQQAIQDAITQGGFGALVGGGASIPMSIAENLEKQGVSRDDALEAAMNAQDRMEAVANDEKAKLSGQATETPTTAPELPGAAETVLSDDPPANPGLVVPPNPDDPNVKAAMSADEGSSAADAENDTVKIRYPKVDDLPDAIKTQLAENQGSFKGDAAARIASGKVSQGDLQRAGLQPLLSKTDVQTLVKSIPQLKGNPKLVAEAGPEGQTILSFSDDNHDMKLKPGAFGLTEERLAAAGVVPGTEIDLTEAIKPAAGSGPIATVQRNGTDYLEVPGTGDQNAAPAAGQPASAAAARDAVPSPTPKSDFSGQAAAGSQSPGKTSSQNNQNSNEAEPATAIDRFRQEASKHKTIDSLQSVVVDMPIDMIKPNRGDTVLRGNPPSQSNGKPIEVRPVTSEKFALKADKDAVGDVVITDGHHRYYEAKHRGDKTIKVKLDPEFVDNNRELFEQRVVAPAAGDRSTTGGRPGAAVRAPAAVGPSGTISTDEKANQPNGKNQRATAAGDGRSPAGDDSGNTSDQPGAGAPAAERPGQTQVGSRNQSGGDPSRQRTLKAIEDHKALSEGRESERPAEEMVKLAQQLNKAAQAGAILRRGDLKSKKAAGMFTRKGGDGKDPKTAKDPRIMLQDAVIKDPQQYATVLAHELSHAMEFYINGNTSKTLDMFDLSETEKTEVTNELKRIVDELEGAAIAQARPEYFYKPTEMLARYVEMRLLFPGKAETMAPKLTEAYESLIVREPMIQDLMMALDNNIDRGAVNKTPYFLKDIKQIYRHRLGKHVGDIAYNAEVRRRAELQRSDNLIKQLIKRKFKGVKDKPEDLFHAAEAVLITKDGDPQFGTHDFLWDVQERDLERSLKAGYTVVEKKPALTDKQTKAILAGETVPDSAIKFEYDLSKVRYTPEQAKKVFDKLSPAGQQLIKDFTTAKEEAKDEFNRELMKDLYHIDSKIEGWVHHFFEGKPMGGNKKASLKHKIAAAKKQRLGAEGYIEDFRQATEKALLELDRNEINNSFIRDQLARISKPIAKGEKPETGWVEVVADEKGGMRLPGEGMQIMIKPDEGKAVKVPQKRYQVPRDLAEHYRQIRDIPAEVNKAARVLNQLAKYWTLNVLVHPGTVSTNFISGGLQYGSKVINDFYLDLLTANFGMSRTRHNLIAPIQVLTPGGWTAAPDWLYGGYRSGTAAGQSMDSTGDSRIDKGIDQYGDKMLKAFGLVETYWKKAIALSEGSDLAGANNRRITERLQAEELKMVDALNEAIDFYAFDYDNKPLWLSKFDRHGGKFVKPFMTYPYKYTKFITSFAAAGFDRSLPWQTRMSKVLTITTIVAFIAMLYHDREEEKTTPDGGDKTPLSLTPGGRVFVGTAQDGKELFVRTTKYPFFNITSLGKAAIEKNGAEVSNILNEMFATVGPGFDLFMLATGRADKFDQYTSISKRVGEMVGSFIPGFRVLSDAGKLIDEKQRKPENFVQGIGSQLPIWGSEETRAKWRGDVRTIKIPDETEAGRSLTKSTRTITEREMTTNKADTLRSLLTGIYVRRIDPEEAKKWELREQRDAAEKTIRDQLAAGNDADAEMLAREHGFTIPNDTFKYYRNKKKKAGQED